MPVGEKMTKVRAATVAQQLNPASAIGLQKFLPYVVAVMDPKRRKSAACFKLFVCVKQDCCAVAANIDLIGRDVFFQRAG